MEQLEKMCEAVIKKHYNALEKLAQEIIEDLIKENLIFASVDKQDVFTSEAFFVLAAIEQHLIGHFQFEMSARALEQILEEKRKQKYKGNPSE